MQLTNKDVAGIPRTPWFPGGVQPARPGWYQRQYGSAWHTEVPDYWDGHSWSIADSEGRIFAPAESVLPWRGLARDPYAEGQHRKDRGIARALEHAGDDWKHAALNKVREFVAGPGPHGDGGMFAFEDVRAWAVGNGLASPPDHHAWGGVAQHAARLGLIVFTGKYRPAAAPRTHGHCVRLYTVGGSA